MCGWGINEMHIGPSHNRNMTKTLSRDRDRSLRLDEIVSILQKPIPPVLLMLVPNVNVRLDANDGLWNTKNTDII